jgi:hypothetical protein
MFAYSPLNFSCGALASVVLPYMAVRQVTVKSLL